MRKGKQDKMIKLTGLVEIPPAWSNSFIAVVSKYGSKAGPIASAMSPKQDKIGILTFRLRVSLWRFSSRTAMNAPAYWTLCSPRAREMSPMTPMATVLSYYWVSSWALSAGYRNGKKAEMYGVKPISRAAIKRKINLQEIFNLNVTYLRPSFRRQRTHPQEQ